MKVKRVMFTHDRTIHEPKTFFEELSALYKKNVCVVNDNFYKRK